LDILVKIKHLKMMSNGLKHQVKKSRERKAKGEKIKFSSHSRAVKKKTEKRKKILEDLSSICFP